MSIGYVHKENGGFSPKNKCMNKYKNSIKNLSNRFYLNELISTFWLPVVWTMLCFFLLIGRWQMVDFHFGDIFSFHELKSTRGTDGSFLFLVWNLFLAWIPLLVSQIMSHYKKGFLWIFLGGIWLLFFPNAPYILTDLLHFKSRVHVPAWYDLLLLISFALTGFLLGIQSLTIVVKQVTEKFSSWHATIFIPLVCFLSGFGVYLGRFERWNSWDLFTRPWVLFGNIAEKFIFPLEHSGALAMSFFLGIIILLGYFQFGSAISKKNQ
jgi:uncharacterized membrane protein